jgi:hypothetical protein
MEVDRLSIRNFAQISSAELTFGDLTVLVGAQGTGKSLALQWLKTAIDGKQICTALHEAGHATDAPEILIDLIFGVGMGNAWSSRTEVTFNRQNVLPRGIAKLGKGREKAFFIPAHRAMLISDGWAAPFQKLTSDTPVVARISSQNLFDRFSARGGDKLFPLERVLKKEYREQIDRAVFHGGTVGLEQDRQHAKRLKLTHGSSQLPFMTWTAGQREFTPLLLGLYHLLPPRKLLKQPDIDWVIVEEPEMGLHPQAVTVFLLLALDLLWRGYRVVLSTHSPHVLTAIWMLRNLQQHRARWQLICRAFNVPPSQQLQKVAKRALEKDYRVHLLEFSADGKMVTSRDISGLDPDGDESEAGWGGLTGFSSRFGDAQNGIRFVGTKLLRKHLSSGRSGEGEG